MNIKTPILTIFALATSVVSAQTLTIDSDKVISTSESYTSFNVPVGETDRTVTIANGATLSIDSQVPFNNIKFANKLTFTGGDFWHDNSTAWGGKFGTEVGTEFVFDCNYTYEVSTTATSLAGPNEFFIGGGKVTFARNFTFKNSISGNSAPLSLKIGKKSNGIGGTTVLTLGTAQKTITEETPIYSLTAGQTTIENASTLIVNNNYSFSSGAFVFADTASKVENYGTFSNTGADDIKGSFANAGTTKFSKSGVIISGTYSNTAGESTFGTGVIVSGTYTNSGGSTMFGTGVKIQGAYNNTGGTSTLKSASILGTYNNTGGSTVFDGGAWVEDGATLVVGGDSSAVVSSGANVTVKAGGTLELNGGKLSTGFVLMDGATLDIKKASSTSWSNVYSGSTINMWASTTYTFSLYGNTTINVMADGLTFQGMAWKNSGSHEVDIVLNGNSLNLGNMTRGDKCTSENLFIDFILAENESWEDNTVKTTMSEAQLNEITFKINGVVTEFDFVATTGGFYLNTVVPEPAEWAMIFGAVALAFVAYRRRR